MILAEDLIGKWQFTTPLKATGTITFSLKDDVLQGILRPSVGIKPSRNLENIRLTDESIDFTIEDWGNFHFIKDTNPNFKSRWVSKNNENKVTIIYKILS
jgi:hypothetical protein